MTNVFIPKEEATCNQTVEQYNAKLITTKDRREGKGRVLAISRMVYRLQKTDTFYVESETCDNNYYFVKFKPDVVEECICSCKDNFLRSLKCKHLWAAEFAIKWGTIKDIDKVPTDIADHIADQNTSNDIIAAVTKPIETAAVTKRRTTKSYLEDDYDF
jgi:predicted nucleic acid-binding Zn finger protein